MPAKMPPPTRDGPGFVIAIAPKPDAGSKMPPPGADQPKSGGKASRDAAGFVKADERCIDCANYDPETGECAKVEGTMRPEDACLPAGKGGYFTPAPEEADEEGEEEDDSRPDPGTGPGGLPEGGR